MDKVTVTKRGDGVCKLPPMQLIYLLFFVHLTILFDETKPWHLCFIESLFWQKYFIQYSKGYSINLLIFIYSIQLRLKAIWDSFYDKSLLCLCKRNKWYICNRILINILSWEWHVKEYFYPSAVKEFSLS